MAKRKRVAVKVYGTTIHVRPSAAKKIKAGTKRDQSQLYNPMAPLSGASLRNTALQQTNLEIAPQLSAYDRQAATTTSQGNAIQSRAGDYYRQAAQQIQDGLQRSQGINAAMLGRVQQAGTTEQDRLTSAQQAATDTTSADATTRGSGLQVGNRVAEELAAARANSAARSATEQGGAAASAGVFENLQNLLGQTTTLRGAERQTELQNMTANQLADIGGKRADVAASAGPLYTKNLTGLRDKAFENQVVTMGLLGDQAKIKADVTKNQQDNTTKVTLARLSNRAKMRLVRYNAKIQAGYHLTAGEQKDLARMGIDIKRGVDPITGKKIPKGTTGTGTGGVKPLTPAEKRAERGDLNKTAGTISNAIGTAKLLKNGPEKLDRHAAAALLLQGRDPVKQTTRDKKTGQSTTQVAVPGVSQYDQLVTSIALDIAYDGHVSYRNYRLAHKRYPGLLRILGVPVNRKQIKKPGLQGVAGIQG